MKQWAMACTTAIVLLASCSKKDDQPAEEVDPSDANKLQSVLVIPGGSLGNSGSTPPAPSASGSGAPVLSNNQTSAAISAGNQLLIPFSFTANSGYTTCYIQVNGATNGYFTIPNPGTQATNGVIAIPVNIPSNVKNGQFTMTYCIADAQGRISNQRTTRVTIKPALTCSNALATGSEGLTFTQVQMGETGGTASLRYDTYSVPDRVDIYQGSTWLGGTGSNPGTTVPPLSNCSNPLPGFVGAAGTINFNYNPSNGRNITVVVSGCLSGGTAWEWKLTCP